MNLYLFNKDDLIVYHTVHRPLPSEIDVCAAGGTGTPFPPCSVSQESPIFVSLTIPPSIQENMGASPDMLLREASAPPPKLVRDDDSNALLFHPTRDSDPCNQTTRSSNFGTS